MMSSLSWLDCSNGGSFVVVVGTVNFHCELACKMSLS